MVERNNQTIQAGARAALYNVDSSLWDWAMIYSAMCWVRMPKSDGSIFKKRYGFDPVLKLFRTFGSLCFTKVDVLDSKLARRWLPAVYLGVSTALHT